MQEDYVGNDRNKNRYPYKADRLIYNINKRIAEYSSNNVIYVVNKFFWEWYQSEKKIVEGLDIVSTHIFEKRKANCFSNELMGLLQELELDEIELVGIDGNYCLRTSALVGEKNGFKISINKTCVGVTNILKFEKTVSLLSNRGIEIIS